MKPLKLTCTQLKSSLRKNLCKARDAWRMATEAGQKKPWITPGLLRGKGAILEKRLRSLLFGCIGSCIGSGFRILGILTPIPVQLCDDTVLPLITEVSPIGVTLSGCLAVARPGEPGT